MNKLTRKKTLQRIILEGEEHFANAYALGRGVIALSAHYGSWELMPAMLSERGFVMNAVVQPEDFPRTDALLVRQRGRCGMKVIPHGHAVRRTLEALRRGEAVAIMGDVELSPHMDIVRFAGKDARMPAGPLRIAIKLQTPIVPAFIRERSDNTFLFRLHPPLIPGPDTRLEELQARVASIIETEISEDPTQWYVFHDVWDMEKSVEFSRVQRVRRKSVRAREAQRPRRSREISA
jgi:KDO2-lipid IV(A) lauroyltransferase